LTLCARGWGKPSNFRGSFHERVIINVANAHVDVAEREIDCLLWRKGEFKPPFVVIITCDFCHCEETTRA
jgi:hypothetical protein